MTCDCLEICAESGSGSTAYEQFDAPFTDNWKDQAEQIVTSAVIGASVFFISILCTYILVQGLRMWHQMNFYYK